jgi:hypothetical protein
MDKDLATFADWFDTYLLKRTPAAEGQSSQRETEPRIGLRKQ